MEYQRKPTGQIELRLHGHRFVSEDNHAEVVIPGDLLCGFRLSEIPEDLAIRPALSGLGKQIAQTCNFALFRYTEGVAWVQVETATKKHQSLFLAALSLAIAERQARVGDVEEDDFFEDERGSTLCYLVTISRDLDVEQAIALVERTVAELEKRREEILDAQSSRFEST